MKTIKWYRWMPAGLVLAMFISSPAWSKTGGFPPTIPPVPETAPNPAAIRDEMLDLNGAWKFGEGEDGDLNEMIVVPYAPQAPASGLGRQVGEVLQYERELQLPADWQGALLHFEGVDYEAEVYVNGRFAARHSGAYAPFAIDVSAFLPFGRAAINGTRVHTVRVVTRDSHTRRDILTGKQERRPAEGEIFYKNMSGIWKGVYIERLRGSYIGRLFLTGDHHGNLFVKAEIEQKSAPAARARLVLRYESDSSPVIQATIPVIDGRLDWSGKVYNVQPWSVETPHLYFAEVELLNTEGQVIDRLQSYTAFTRFSQADGYLTENGKPFHVRGHLNQHVYPDTLYTTTDKKVLAEIEYFRAAGFNCERFHQNTPRWRDLFLFARHGVRISLELPSARDLRDPGALRAAAAEWREIQLNYAGPAVSWRVAVNETWGLLHDPSHIEELHPGRIEEMQRLLHWTTSETQRDMLPSHARNVVVPLQPFNDGWQSITPTKNGAFDTTIHPDSHFVAIHDYATADVLLEKYLSIPTRYGKDTQIPANQREVLMPGFELHDDVPIMLSEMGGRAVTSSDNPKIFAYHGAFTETGAWAQAMAATITVAGLSPVFRAGYVITQSMDAGNNPADPDSAGELNGLLRADGTPKMPAAYWRTVNDQAHAHWQENLAHHQSFRMHRRDSACELLIKAE